MLEKIVIIDKIEVLENGNIQVRQATKIIEDGQEIGKIYHRHVLDPGDSLDGQDAKVTAIAGVVWKPGVVAAYKAYVESQSK